MKKSLFILAFIILAINQTIFGQDTDIKADKNAERKITIQTNPLLWFSDVFSFDMEGDGMLFAMDLEGQFKVNNSINISLTLSFLFDNHTVFSYPEDYSYNERYDSYNENVFQTSLKPMFIYRPFQTGLRGFFLGFYPNIGILHVKNNEIDRLYTEVGFGIRCGYKFIFRDGFTLQLGGGIGKTFSIPEGSNRYVTINSDGRLQLTHTDIQLLELKMGYSF
jgi:hypothetical protein